MHFIIDYSSKLSSNDYLPILMIVYCTILLHMVYYSTNVTDSPSYVQRVLLKLIKKYLTSHNVSF
jgi:hypothetical protein